MGFRAQPGTGKARSTPKFSITDQAIVPAARRMIVH
jgi:hypothetical protein